MAKLVVRHGTKRGEGAYYGGLYLVGYRNGQKRASTSAPAPWLRECCDRVDEHVSWTTDQAWAADLSEGEAGLLAAKHGGRVVRVLTRDEAKRKRAAEELRAAADALVEEAATFGAAEGTVEWCAMRLRQRAEELWAERRQG